jgi:hypothetical protein
MPLNSRSEPGSSPFVVAAFVPPVRLLCQLVRIETAIREILRVNASIIALGCGTRVLS